MVSGALAQAMCNAQAVHNRLDHNRVHRLPSRALFAHVGGISTAFHVGFVEIDTMKNKLLALGVGGTILAVLCCFKPLLPVALTALGRTGLLGVVYNDAVLLPILAGFLILTGYAIWRQKTQK
ncbi:MAG: mercury resistance system transport protein MerF [Pseudomonadota bacterium]